MNKKDLLAQLKAMGLTADDLAQMAKEDKVEEMKGKRNEELVEMFLEHKAEKEARDELTIEAYNYDLVEFLKWYNVKGKSVLDITKKEAGDYIYFLRTKARTKRGNPYAISTIIRKHATLMSFYSYLNEELEILNTHIADIKKRNMFKEIEQISTSHLKTEHDCLTEEEVEELVRTIETETKRRSAYIVARNHLLFRLIISSGLRVSEALSLTPANFNYKRNVIDVIGKRNKQRDTLFVKTIRDELEEYMKIRATVQCSNPEDEAEFGDLLFVNEDGTAMDYRKVNKALQKYLKASNIDLEDRKITTHSLRHTFATLKIQNGETAERVKELCGHNDLNFTLKHYVHVTTNQNDEEMASKMGIK